MSMDLSEYEYLWNGSQTGWVLLENDEKGPDVFNELNGVLLHIDNKRVHAAICSHLRSLGVKTISKIRPIDHLIEDTGEIDDNVMNFLRDIGQPTAGTRPVPTEQKK